MRAPAVLLNVVVACAVGGALGYSLATKVKQEEIAHLQSEREVILARERALRSQLEEALTSRQALEQEAQRLQNDFNDRLHRLEELAAQLPPPAEHSAGKAMESEAKPENEQLPPGE